MDILREARAVSGEAPSIRPQVGGFLNGFTIAISNPKDIIFFASLFQQFIGVTSSENVSITLLTVVWIILNFATLMVVYAQVRTFIRPSVHGVALRISAGVLLVIAMVSVMTSVAGLCGSTVAQL